MKIYRKFFEKFREVIWKVWKIISKIFDKHPRKFQEIFWKKLQNFEKYLEYYFGKFWEWNDFEKHRELFRKISRNISGSSRIITEIFGIISENFWKIWRIIAKEKKFENRDIVTLTPLGTEPGTSGTSFYVRSFVITYVRCIIPYHVLPHSVLILCPATLTRQNSFIK